jgi:hypothetical protein
MTPAQTPTALQMTLREAKSFMYYDQEGQIKGEGWTFFYQPFTTTDLLTWKQHTPFFTEKSQGLIYLMQSIIQTHKPTWKDCQQLLLTLFNTGERLCITLASLKWLEDHGPEGTLNFQAYAQAHFTWKTPTGTPIIAKIAINMSNISRH